MPDEASGRGHVGFRCHCRARLIVLLTVTPLLLWLVNSAVMYDGWDNTRPSVPSLNGPEGNPGPVPADWISVEIEPNFTSTLLARWRAGASNLTCRTSGTSNISIPGLDGNTLMLRAGPVHEFTIFSMYHGDGRRCLGGDYFEADLSGPRWKARPPVKDLGDGSYSLRLQVHPDFAGDYNLTVTLLFHRYEGLRFSTKRFALDRELRRIHLRFEPADTGPAPLRRCRAADFSRGAWSGRWTRHGGDDGCEVGPDGRYRCVPPGLRCPAPWCDGPLAALESNGWVYSAHCSYQLFTAETAWRCLRGKWLFFWGDSNHVDTIRNLLTFVLAVPAAQATVDRRFDRRFANPNQPSEWVRITSVFNGHWNESLNYEGLRSLRNRGFRALVRGYFEGERPDAVVLNSGLHDGIYWRSIRAFAEEGAEDAAAFWEEVLRSRVGGPKPAVFYRTTVAVGGYARAMSFNPQKMETFNRIMVEKMKARGLLTGGVIDHFDMTFPWHWDNRCNDGVHYGRAPARARWRDGRIGHHYFVDLMLVHVLLNAVCNAS